MSDNSEKVVIKTVPLRKTMSTRQVTCVQIGRELYGLRSFTNSLRFNTKTRANKVAAFLVAEYVEDGSDVIVVGSNGKERLIRGT